MKRKPTFKLVANIILRCIQPFSKNAIVVFEAFDDDVIIGYGLCRKTRDEYAWQIARNTFWEIV